MEHAAYVYTTGLDDDEVTGRLASADHCVLALADGDDSYAIPVSAHYRDGRVLVRLSDHDDATKFDYLDATETATLVFYDVDEDGDSWSVLLRGELSETETPDEATLDEWFGPFHLFDEGVTEVTFRVFELDADGAVGRETI